ncbi:MAG: D-alanine--D-alanine ligase, partial [Planctomycetota bacterium]
MRVLVLAGGPDAERDVSISSGTAIAGALAAQGVSADLRLIDAPDSLADLVGDVIFPSLHGPWGEGGPLQDVLERDGRPYVGCGPRAARLCMDKLAAKLVAAHVGVSTGEAALLNRNDSASPIEPPAVVKPVFEGSSVGLHLCHDEAALADAVSAAHGSDRLMMVERLIRGREITCGLIDSGDGLRALPVIEIVPAGETYDYEAKYDRDDTQYLVGGDAAPLADHGAVQQDSLCVASALGVRHLARVDYIVDDSGRHHFLEINTMPGFTTHSLLPKAAAASGTPMGELCKRLCELAAARHSSPAG